LEWKNTNSKYAKGTEANSNTYHPDGGYKPDPYPICIEDGNEKIILFVIRFSNLKL